MLVALSGCDRKDVALILPKAYTGWVEVEILNDRCDGLQGDRRGPSVKVARDGRVCTSADLRSTISGFRFYDGDSLTPLPDTNWGGGGRVWAAAGPGIKACVGPCQSAADGGLRSSIIFFDFFIGTEAQFRSDRYPHP